jgi:hypothetical protein
MLSLTCVRVAKHSHDNFFFIADAWKMDYGGHDSKFRDNIVYHGTGSFHGGNDGQNCVNAWPMATAANGPATNAYCQRATTSSV